jgi:hypothetical protein
MRNLTHPGVHSLLRHAYGGDRTYPGEAQVRRRPWITAGGLALAALLLGATAPAATATAATASHHGLPSSVTITEHKHAKFTTTSTDLAAGLITFTLVNKLAAKQQGELQLFSLKGTTTLNEFRAHLAAAMGPSFKKAAKAIRWIRRHVLAWGGSLGSPPTMTQEVVLRAGTYYVADTSSWIASKGKRGVMPFTVSGNGTGTLPSVGQSVSMVDNAKGLPRFKPSSPVLHPGRLRINNTSNDLHMVFIAPVTRKATKKSIIAAFENPKAPSPFTGPPQGSDVVSPRLQTNIRLVGPAHRYVITCFVPDPKTGMPHILMGMITFVHIR